MPLLLGVGGEGVPIGKVSLLGEPEEDLLARAVDYYQSLLTEIKAEESA